MRMVMARTKKNLDFIARGVTCALMVAGAAGPALAAMVEDPYAPALTPAVNGIYTDNSTKDVGEVTGIPFFKGVKFRGWLEGYYVNNFKETLINSSTLTRIEQ